MPDYESDPTEVKVWDIVQQHWKRGKAQVYFLNGLHLQVHEDQDRKLYLEKFN